MRSRATSPVSPDFSRLLVEGRAHLDALEQLGIEALSHDEPDLAFYYIDRLCRVSPIANPHYFALRAEALVGMGEATKAADTFSHALDLAPEDIQINRRLLSWVEGPLQNKAAKTVLKIDLDPKYLIEAAKILRKAGQKAAGVIRTLDTNIRGWAVWDGPEVPEIVISGNGIKLHKILTPEANSFLYLAGFESAGRFSFTDRPATPEWQAVYLQDQSGLIASQRLRPSLATPREETESKVGSGSRGLRRSLTVIVPIFRDHDAVQTCLEGVWREAISVIDCHIILINDASPESEITDYLLTFSKLSNVTIISNECNLGFVASVNMALSQVPRGDVLLLNADTVLPRRLFQRLSMVAKNDPSIGTITPLSNNGEFTSFPRRFYANPLPEADELDATDAAAAVANPNWVIDIPSGIGFCLYITHACLQAVGFLSDCFDGGYLEDVDFCRRAREHGFRNVCTGSIFVGHHGARSFLGDKRRLVARNTRIIDERFPNDRPETAAFLLADPLRPACASIERLLAARITIDIVMVIGNGAAGMVAEARARELHAEGHFVLLLVNDRDQYGPIVRFRNPTGAIPQSLIFRLEDKAELGDLDLFMSELKFARIELTDPSHTPMSLLTILQKTGKPVDILIADAGLFCPPGFAASSQVEIETMISPKQDLFDEIRLWRERWSSVIQLADQIIAPNEAAEHFITTVLPERRSSIKHARTRAVELPPSLPEYKHNAICGLVATGTRGQDVRLIQDLAPLFLRILPGYLFVVFGHAFDDRSLLSLGNVFITGYVEPNELTELWYLYRVKALFNISREPLFGYPAAIEAEQSGLPLAYFDWTFGTGSPRPDDLALSPNIPLDMLAEAVSHWLELAR